MICGQDIVDVFNVRITQDDLLSVVKRVGELWPDAVVEIENVPVKSIQDIVLGDLPVGAIREVFVFSSLTTRDRWEAEGWSQELDNEMIMVACTEMSITVVAGEFMPTEMSRWATRLAGDHPPHLPRTGVSMTPERVIDQGIRGGDWLDEGTTRIRAAQVASDNPMRSTDFYGFRVCRRVFEPKDSNR